MDYSHSSICARKQIMVIGLWDLIGSPGKILGKQDHFCLYFIEHLNRREGCYTKLEIYFLL